MKPRKAESRRGQPRKEIKGAHEAEGQKWEKTDRELTRILAEPSRGPFNDGRRAKYPASATSRISRGAVKWPTPRNSLRSQNTSTTAEE